MGESTHIEVPTADDSTEQELWDRTASMAELGVMTASLLHEMRQPLFAIKAHAQLGQVRGDSERFKLIVEQVQYLEELLRYYGGFGKSDRPDTEYNLNEAVGSALAMMTHRARKANVSLEHSLYDGVALICGREASARQIAVNLIQNACDAAEGTEDAAVFVSTYALGDVVRLSVEDNGPGIPEDVQQRLFEPFYTTKSEGKGTGLGLYITRRLVQESGGSMRIELPSGGGTRFEVDFPRSITEMTEQPDPNDLGFG